MRGARRGARERARSADRARRVRGGTYRYRPLMAPQVRGRAATLFGVYV
jgi:hypothetical protein